MNKAPSTRRRFLSQFAAGTATAAGLSAAAAGPMILTRSRTSDEIITGEGEHRFRVQHDWPQLPDRFSWQTTHNVAVDKSGHLYVIHEGRRNMKDHPSIFVFDSEG